MKRYFRIQVAVLCLIAIICGVNGSHVSAKMSNRTVHKKYMTTLLKLNKQLTKNGYINAQGPIYFCYIDFDHDGIDECMVNGHSLVFGTVIDIGNFFSGRPYRHYVKRIFL